MNRTLLRRLLVSFVPLIFVFGWFPLRAQDIAQEGQEEPPKTFPEALQSMQETLLGLWSDFVEHLPLLVAGIMILGLTTLAAILVRSGIRRSLARSRFRKSLQDLLQQLAYVAVWIVGLMIAAVIIFPGLTPTKALGGLGILSLAVGFAFKDIFENFFAGVILLWRFPFEPGDFIECNGIMGRVEDITIRLTTIRKTTDELVVVPNSFLFTNPVDVLTNRAERRMTIMAGVAYDVDVEQAVAVIQEAVGSCSTVSREHEIQVFPLEFGDSSINIEVAWWCGSTPLAQRKSRGEVVTAIKRELDRNGLEIPFPYRTLTFKEPLRIQRESESTGNAEP